MGAVEEGDRPQPSSNLQHQHQHQHQQPAGWKLLWVDEFAKDELDESKWSLCKRGKPDWKNTMSDDPRLLSVAGGVLHLRAIVNDRKQADPAPYLTAGVTTRSKFAYHLGKVQIRARFKSAAGAWPALWMLGEKRSWPANGEIDLMEHLNFDRKIYQTVHSGFTAKGKRSQAPKNSGTAKINRDDWNTYGCEWDEEKIVLTVNNQTTFTYPRMRELGAEQWPFDQPFYLILSMQVGGKWVNSRGPTNPEHYPAGMEIDWVRVYQQSDPPGHAASE